MKKNKITVKEIKDMLEFCHLKGILRASKYDNAVLVTCYDRDNMFQLDIFKERLLRHNKEHVYNVGNNDYVERYCIVLNSILIDRATVQESKEIEKFTEMFKSLKSRNTLTMDNFFIHIKYNH